MTEDVFSTEELQDYLRSFLVKNTKLVSPKFHITKPSKEGDNYMGMVYRVTIDGIEDGEIKNIDLIVKTIRNIDIMKEMSSVYQREILFYQTILPIFKESVKEHGGIVTRCPFFYDANTEFGRETLILENLTPKGFIMSKSIILDYPHLSLALRCLGEFHAYSFITRASNPTRFEKLKIIDHWHDPKITSDFFPNIINSYSKIVCDIVIKALRDEDKQYTERFARFVDNLNNEMYDAVDWKQAEPHAVLIHGDFWTNNMLFKYDREGKPCDMRFIDFQICRYASPVIDIVYVLFCCCTPETRRKYYDQLIHEYHEALTKCLESCGYSNDLFPYELLSQHLLKFGKYSAGIATVALPVFLKNDSENKSLSHIFSRDVLENRLETDSGYRNFIKSVFKDCIDKNYI